MLCIVILLTHVGEHTITHQLCTVTHILEDQADVLSGMLCTDIGHVLACIGRCVD